MAFGQISNRCLTCMGLKKSPADEYSPAQIYQPLLFSLSTECLKPCMGTFESLNVSKATPIIELNGDDRKSAPYLIQIFSCLNAVLFSKSSDILGSCFLALDS